LLEEQSPLIRPSSELAQKSDLVTAVVSDLGGEEHLIYSVQVCSPSME